MNLGEVEELFVTELDKDLKINYNRINQIVYLNILLDETGEITCPISPVLICGGAVLDLSF